MALKVTEELGLTLLQLALKQGEHAPGHGSQRVVLIILQILVRGERHDSLDRIQVVLVQEAFLGVARDVDAAETAKLSQKFLPTHRVVDGNNAGTSGLKELSMRGLEVALVSQFEVIVPLAWQGLRQDTDDGLVVNSTSMVTLVLQDLLTLVTAQMGQTFTFYAQKR